MRKFHTQGIILARTNYGEADRILTFLTPDNGKVKIIAKGVRKPKSKLAGGIELFSVSDLGVFAGRSEINTLASSRLLKHYANIVKDLGRTDLAYNFIAVLHKSTEDHPEPAYFELLQQAFEALDDNSIDPELINVWFYAQMLRLAGHSPNLKSEKSGTKLQADRAYEFNLDTMAFQLSEGGQLNADQIKFLRLIFSDNQPKTLQKVQGAGELSVVSRPLINAMSQLFLRHQRNDSSLASVPNP